jgi:hypothetical protein
MLCLAIVYIDDDISMNIIISYEKLFIGNGFWVMPRQCQNMLYKGRVKRANLYLKAICSAFTS